MPTVDTRATDRPFAEAARHDRQFYALNKAIGRFGMRIFTPKTMEASHWHGHIEANFLTGARMTYALDEARVVVEPDQFVLFWAGIPHQLIDIMPTGDQPVRLANIYIPFDAFLFMPHIADLHVMLLGGAVVALPEGLCSAAIIHGWYRDYRSRDFERIEVMKMEINAMLRRALLGDVHLLRDPIAERGEARELGSTHIGHVVAMVRYITENLERPMSNADVAAVTGLHQNYALSLFTRTMRMPMKRFIIRMRLLRARALLIESTMAISTVAETAGFASISQFYDHFKTAYGMPPNAMRDRYTRMVLR